VLLPGCWTTDLKQKLLALGKCLENNKELEFTKSIRFKQALKQAQKLPHRHCKQLQLHICHFSV